MTDWTELKDLQEQGWPGAENTTVARDGNGDGYERSIQEVPE